jgi:DNA-binding transcriptional MerR regulator
MVTDKVLSMTMLIDSLDARRAAEACGFESVAMLDYLQRSEVFVPTKRKTKRGKGRRYSFRDLIVLKTIAALLKNGASVAALRKSLQEFQKKKWSADQVTLENDDGPLKYFVVSGESIFFAKTRDNLFDMTKNGQMAFSFIVDLDHLHRELCRDLGLPTLQGELSLSG